jgi:radical SAM superfamily enzyme YgiQ (UPF0313 family)
MTSESPARHLVLATIQEGVRVLSIRVLGGYTQGTLGVRTTLLCIVKPLPSEGNPILLTPKEVRQIHEFLERERVTHLGFYLMTAGFKPFRQLVMDLRELGYRGLILAGGVHATLLPEESLVEGADFAVQGPGEIPLKMIFEGADPATIPGLVWRKDGAVVVNPMTPEQKTDLDTLPFPIFRYDEDKVLLDGKLKPLSRSVYFYHSDWNGESYDLITSRGCLYNCAYCCHADRGAIRRMSVDRAIREILEVRKNHPEIRQINIQDDVFFVGSDEWVEEFCKRYKEEVGLRCIIRMIPRFGTPERIAILKDAGLYYVTMGLEGSDRVNKQVYHRPETRDTFLKAAKAVLRQKIHLSIDIIIDNPYEKEADLRHVAETLNELPRGDWNTVTLSLTPFPNTVIYEQARKDGLLDRFVTHAYDSMLTPSREGAYRTPFFWRSLFLKILPQVSPKMGEKLIGRGPDDPWAAQTVARMVAFMDRVKAITFWTHRNLPTFYGLSTALLKGLRFIFFRKKVSPPKP